jgi:hypothetical protein
MDATDNQVIVKWAEFKALVETLELDVVKNAKGVAAAGVRARKGLRELKTRAAELVKTTVETDKAKRAAKPPKAAKAQA